MEQKVLVIFLEMSLGIYLAAEEVAVEIKYLEEPI